VEDELVGCQKHQVALLLIHHFILGSQVGVCWGVTCWWMAIERSGQERYHLSKLGSNFYKGFLLLRAYTGSCLTLSFLASLPCKVVPVVARSSVCC